MTHLNTIIEEEKREAEKLTNMVVRMMQGMYNSNDARIADVRRAITNSRTTAMQRAYEAGRSDWLRSEIEKLEKKHEELLFHPVRQADGIANYDYNMGAVYTITSIITRYKEELLELEKGV